MHRHISCMSEEDIASVYRAEPLVVSGDTIPSFSQLILIHPKVPRPPKRHTN